MRLILIRHGETPSNVANVLDTAHPGPGLTELGHTQAHGLVERLEGSTIEAIFVSNLVRTHLTAMPLAQHHGLTPIERDGLREISAGDLEMAGDEPSILAYRDVVNAWCDGDLEPRLGGGERGHQVLSRFDEVVAEAVDLGLESVAIVSHGAMIRCWAANRAVNVPAGFGGEHLLRNTDTVILDRVAGEWYLRSWSHVLATDAGLH